MPHIYSIYEDSKLFELVFSFAELVQTDLWAVWAEQHAQCTLFLSKTTEKEDRGVS